MVKSPYNLDRLHTIKTAIFELGEKLQESDGGDLKTYLSSISNIINDPSLDHICQAHSVDKEVIKQKLQSEQSFSYAEIRNIMSVLIDFLRESIVDIQGTVDSTIQQLRTEFTEGIDFPRVALPEDEIHGRVSLSAIEMGQIVKDVEKINERINVQLTGFLERVLVRIDANTKE